MEKGEHFYTIGGMQVGAATAENSMEIPQKIKNGSAFQSSYPTSGNIHEGTPNINSKEHKYPNVPYSVIYNCQHMEATQVSINA